MTDGGAKKILFIDDDVFLEKIVRYNLKDRSYQFTATQNGEDAIKILQSRAQDMIILDLIMPRMDGWKFLDWLREDRALASLPIIILTAHKLEKAEVKQKYGDCNIVEIIEKPFDLLDLTRLIEDILGN
jgi:CheY-like chemotaxis protein